MDEVKDKSGQEIDVSSWDREFVTELPEQENGYDWLIYCHSHLFFQTFTEIMYLETQHVKFSTCTL